MRERLRRMGEKFPPLGTALEMQDRYKQSDGAVFAQSLALTLFLSVFPLLLVATAVIGFVTSDDPNVTQDLVSKLGLNGVAADTFRMAVENAQRSRKSATIVGFGGLLFAALGIITGMKRAVDRPWQMRGQGFKDFGPGLFWLVGGGVLLAVSGVGVGIVLAILGSFGTYYLPLLATVVNVLFFWFTFRVLGSSKVGWRPLLPGAIAAGIGFQVLTLIGRYFVPRAVASSSALYGSIGVVFAILAFLFLFARLVVYTSALNVVLFERAEGTRTVEIQAPLVPGQPIEDDADRSGVVQPVT